MGKKHNINQQLSMITAVLLKRLNGETVIKLSEFQGLDSKFKITFEKRQQTQEIVARLVEVKEEE